MNSQNKLTKLPEIILFLEKAFDLINRDWFDNQLERPVITIAPTTKLYGHYTMYNAWSVDSEQKREINISCYTIKRPIKEVISTLVHEMTHMYNDLILNVKDCSNRGRYHNKMFKKAAEEHGLLVLKDPRNGWSITTPSEALLKWIKLHPEFQDICTYKIELEQKKSEKKKTNRFQFEYKCSFCGTFCKSTERITVFCKNCNKQMY